MQYREQICVLELKQIGVVLTENNLNLLYCFDENYNLQTTTSAYSFLNNYSGRVSLHLLTSSKNKIKKYTTQLNQFKNLDSINVYEFKKNRDFVFPAIDNHHVTEATYYRLFINEYLPKTTKDLLYLDSDVITLNNVTDKINKIFHKLNIEKQYLGAVNYTKSTNENNKKFLQSLNMKSDNYFNAGVLFINYKLWENDYINQKILDHTKNMGNLNNLKQHDQDILNSFFDGKFLSLNEEYNFPVLERSYKKDKNFIDHETFFLHYVGREKPWLLNGFFLEISKYYQKNYFKLYKNYHLIFKKKLGFKDIKNNFKIRYLLHPKKIYSLFQVIKLYFYKL